MSAYRILLVGLGVALMAGCVPHTDEPAPAAATGSPAAQAPLRPDPPMAPAAAAVPAPTEGTVTTSEAESSPAQPADTAATNPPAEAPAVADAPAATEAPVRVAAEAGVGKQGQSLKNESGIMVEAAKAYFNVRQRGVFDIQIPSAMKLFEATEGRKPKSQEEFMEKIVKANSIKLPTLPAKDKYVYDVERGELMVEKQR